MIIKSNETIFKINLKEILEYKDLIFYFVKRDFVTFYKQTILGPLWYLLQPLLSASIYYIIFLKIAKIEVGNNYPFLFFMSGNIIWIYFSENLTKTSDTFIHNASIFGKVYFPRLIVPISTTISGLLSTFLQLFLLIFLLFFSMSDYLFFRDVFRWILTIPILFYIMIQSMSWGIMISALTTKYRDLRFVLRFGLQLWMFASPVVYSVNIIPDKYMFFYNLNPVVMSIELFRWIYLPNYIIKIDYLLLNISESIIILILSLLLFNKVEKNFIDII